MNKIRNMKLLVHLHVYYHDQVGYFAEKLRNISGCEWSLFVTMSTPDAGSESVLRSVKPDAVFIRTANVGYDIWPFISVMKSVRLEDYDLVMKLHTKGPSSIAIHHVRLDGYGWRNALTEALLKDEGRFHRILSTFRDRPSTGLLCSDIFLMLPLPWTDEDSLALDKELSRIGLDVRDRHFCVGTMFIARTSCYRFLQEADITEDMFPKEQISHSGGTMAHVYERILSMAPSAYGFRARGLVTRPAVSAWLFTDRIFSALFKNIFSINREGYDRHKVLRVAGLKFRLK